MKGILLTAPRSNSGKTTITSGLARAISRRGIRVAPFKTGPDYIDGKYLSLAAGRMSGNLDFHLQGVQGIKEAVGMEDGDLALVEGVMGYFDGSGGSWESSSYHLTKILDIPAVLVYTPKGEMFSAVASIKGMAEFEDSRIKAVILNKTSEKMYGLLREAIEKHTGLKVLGHLPFSQELHFESESLGLREPGLHNYGQVAIESAADLCERYIDLDSLIRLATDISPIERGRVERTGKKVALARDEAFCFHYSENLRILESMAHVTYFSPLKDQELPDSDLVIIGGGYPEKHKEGLAENRSMIESIRRFGEAGGHILAEGGGLMYLMESMDKVPMCGLLKGNAVMTEKLQRFGYVCMELMEDCLLGRKGQLIHGNEFHKSLIEDNEGDLLRVTKPMGNGQWTCGYRRKNILGYYQHINYAGKVAWLWELLERTGKGGL